MKKTFTMSGWGGVRKNAGRKREISRGVSHREREHVSGRTPVHINFKYRTHVRNKTTLKLLKRSISNARSHGLRVLHFSFQTNHVHLIVEADNNALLTLGMRSLTITFARGMKMGKVQVQRYHLHVLRTIQETRNAINYVLFNQQRHEKGTCSTVNEYSSVLSLQDGILLVQNWSRRKKMVLRIENGEGWKADSGLSYLSNRAMKLLTSSSRDTASATSQKLLYP